MATLQIDAASIGDFYFSGSQSVLKGQEVAWILDDIFAFKTTEACKISANKTPFIEIGAGQTFIIKKGMKYVFDMDTVIAFAYPQENTQDILIQNDIYNDNKSIINIEADQTPRADAGSNQDITVGQTASLYGTATAIAPATVASVKWTLNGTTMSTSAAYNYTPSAIGNYDLVFTVTDSNGRMATDTVQVRVAAAIVIQPTTYKDDTQLSAWTTESVWTTIFQITASQTHKTNGVCKLDYTAGFDSTWTASSYGNYYSPSSASIRLTVNGVSVYTGTISSPNPESRSTWLKVASATFNRTINSGDVIKLETNWTSDKSVASFGSSSYQSINGEMQLVVEN